MMIVYKKVTRDFKEFILTLEVPDNAVVKSDARGTRVSEAKVIKAERLNGKPTEHTEFYAMYDWSFVYRVGQNVYCAVGDDDHSGIHCYDIKFAAQSFMGFKLAEMAV